jgi:hypothetical protein
MDDSLSTLPVVSGSNRSTTPSKIQIFRALTPQRSNSANKSKDIARAIVESTRAQSSSRDISRRKQRRRDNNNMVGLFEKMTIEDIDYSNNDEFEDLGLIDNRYKSVFTELFEKENSNAKLFFLSCNKLPLARCSQSQRKYKSEAHKSWAGVEKRLRNVVVASLKNESLKSFVTSIEIVLIYFQVRRSNPPDEFITDSLNKTFRNPLKCFDGKLVFSLLDSSFYRLLLHATCQYHGLRSQSINSDEKGLKDTVVELRKSGYIGHGISLISVVENDNQPSTI